MDMGTSRSMIKDVIEWSEAKAYVPIEETLAGIFTFARLLQYLKAPLPISVTP
jgi:hypothetical protein